MQEAKKIAKIIKKSNKIVLFHHENPDGDSLSSSFGLMQAIKEKYPEKTVKWFADKTFIKNNFNFLIKDFSDSISKIDSSWTAIVGDNGVLKRIFGFKQFQKAGIKVCFDHHMNKKDFDVDYYWYEPTLSASAIQAFEIAKAIKTPFNKDIALHLLFGILTDTYNFMYSLAETWPLKAATELLTYIDNASMDKLYKDYKKRTQKDIKFEAFVLSNYKIKDNVGFLKITNEDLQKLSISPNQASKVNLISNIEKVYAWMFLIEDQKNKNIKISLRSCGFPVNEVANKFGGGGHQRAAGIKIDLNWKKADKIIEETIKGLKWYLNKVV